MIRYLLILIISYNFLYCDLNDFDTRQDTIQKIKEVVQSEESIARAYEQYILDNFNPPSSGFTSLKTASYLGTSFPTNIDSIYFNNFIVGTPVSDPGIGKISYALKDELKADNYLKALYEGSTFRKRTYYQNDAIHILIEDVFAKHLYDLYGRMNLNSTAIDLIGICSISNGIYCIENDHVYIYDDNSHTNLLMYYYKDKFKTGPIIITNDTDLHSTNDEFNSIPKGALLYDTDGTKYVKTSTSIEVLK